MARIASEENIEDTRRVILDAAEARFRTYGYGKTTMAEIASDAGMSAANLYRFFQNKYEIGCAVSSRCMAEHTARLREVVRNTKLPASEKLRTYVLTCLYQCYEGAGKDNNINDLVQKILDERQDLVQKKVDAEIGLIAEILAQGNSSGEFEVADLIETATSIQTAIVMFNVPTLMGLYSQERFKELANGVVNLLLVGIKKR